MSKHKFLIFLLVISLTILHSKELTTNKNLIEGELSNGFKYSILKNSKPKKRAEFRLLVNIGSLEEDEDQKGIAHFIEHMAFNGSKHFKQNELIQYLESIGLHFGSHLNASTGYERTLYKLTIPLKKDNLEKSFLVLEDWAGGLSFNPKELEKERGVILEEERSRDTVYFRLYNQFKSMLLGDSKYMDRVPIGDTEIIKNISIERVKDFYNDWYRPEFMHFIAVGDFDVKEIEAKIKKHFSTLKNKSKRKRALREIADTNETRVKFLTDPELTANSFSVQYMDVITSRRTKEDIRDEIIQGMMFSLFNMKADEQLLKKNPKATSIALSADRISSHKGSYAFDVSYRGENEKEALHELYALIGSFEKYGFSEENLKLIKKEKNANNEKWYKRRHDRYSSSLASYLVSDVRSNSIYTDEKLEYTLNKELISDIKLEEINNYFRKFLKIKDRVFIFQNTTGNRLSQKIVLETIDEAKNHVKDLTKVDKLAKNIIDEELNSSKIVSKKFHQQGEFHEFMLKNGIKVIFKQTDFSKNRMALESFSFGGYSLYDVPALDNAQKATSFIAQSGAGDFSVIDINKILSDKQIFTSTSLSELTENIHASSNSKDAEEMFKLLYLKITQPKIDEMVANNIKRELKDRVKQEERNPKIKFYKEYVNTYFKKDPRILFDSIKSIDKLENAEMLKIYKERFSDMNNFTFVLIGDIELKVVEKLIAKYLANLPSQEKVENFIDREQDYLKGNQTFNRAYNNQNITQVFISFRSKLAYSKKIAFLLEAMKSILEIRLRELIREEKSAVYSISVIPRLSRLGSNNSRINISFTCDPKRADELISAVLDETEKLKEEVIKEKELDVYRKKFELAQSVQLKENNYWLSKLIATYKYNTTLDYELFQLPTLLKGIRVEDIREVAGTLFSEDRMVSKLEPHFKK
ncbi:MAG: Probable zinc protease pqqL (EC [uncultured Sulfurovum sp.]|uniref:Probable zinc protease pqqL (EC) n=1 Tax=uncultured Sulfurovum sp. TaxID=269237 RepID=A0A6S6TX94_9BACT|nr:MAG: Probable zinc protease pqqL (EC [uncultured Sulfurovum sp.]